VSAVLDASAPLAYLNDEPGARRVEAVLAEGAVIGAANWAEVLSRVSDAGIAPPRLVAELTEAGLVGTALRIEPLLPVDGERIVGLRPVTRRQGLSLGDRACLALALRLQAPVLTTDRTWGRLRLPLEIVTLR